MNNTLLVSPCVCQALLYFGIEGNSFSVFSLVDLWMVEEWTKGYLAHAQLSHCEVKFQNSIPIETEATPPRKSGDRHGKKAKVATQAPGA